MNGNFERKIYKKLSAWKKLNVEGNKTALVIKGARQVGKTTIVKHFAQQEYEHIVYINFMNEQKYNSCFEKDLEVDYITQQLNIKNEEFKFYPYKTVIIFDEVQECARARSSIKAFCEDGRYDIIATGSLLGVLGYNRNKTASIPVGFETHLQMYAMDFEEYLWAIGVGKDKIKYLADKLNQLIPIDQPAHEKFLEEYKKFLLIGGMPKAIKTYLTTHDIHAVRAIQQSIMETYRSDFGKHLNTKEQAVTNNNDYAKLNRIYNSIPQQIAREEKDGKDYNKFKFSEVSHDAKFRNYVDVIQWLEDAGIIHICYNVKDFKEPLLFYKKPNQFKIYMNDIGLLMSTLPNSIVESLSDARMGEYKGYIYENLIADQLIKNGISLYYFGDSRFEIDFVVSTMKQTLLMEVKSKRGKSKSINAMIKNNYVKAIKLSGNNIGFTNGMLTIPYYLSFLITDDFIFPGNDKN